MSGEKEGRWVWGRNGRPEWEVSSPQTRAGRQVTPPQPLAVSQVQAQIRTGNASAAASEATTRETNSLLPFNLTKADAEALSARVAAALVLANQGVDQKLKSENQQLFDLAYGMGPDVKSIKQRFNEGPGRTSGIAGIVDMNPWDERNARLNAASNKLRGFVKNTQGFTSGEGNTVSEMKMNVGSFIPSSFERDGVTRDNIAALERERLRGMRTAIANMRGIPDQNGRVTPIPLGYVIGQYPDLDDAVIKAMSRVPPAARGKYMLDAKSRYEAAKRKAAKRAPPRVRILGELGN